MARKIGWLITYTITYFIVGVVVFFITYILFPMNILSILITAALIFLLVKHIITIKVIILVIVLISFLFAIRSVHNGVYEEFYKGRIDKSDDQSVKPHIGMFAGMPKQAAKKMYRTLMKQYHPDNQDGNEEISKMITEEFEEYKSSTERK